MKLRRAMTLGEALITLAIIGLLAGITIPTLTLIIPDKSEVLHKKAAYVLEHTVAEVVNNENYYPVKKTITTDEEGNAITTSVYGLRNTDSVTENGVTCGGDTKFCCLMASKFNLAHGSEVNCSSEATYNLTSNDGIQWKFPTTDFNYSDEDDDPEIRFKTMDRKGGDCIAMIDSDNPGTLTLVPENCKNPNIFVYEISPEGKLRTGAAISDKLRD